MSNYKYRKFIAASINDKIKKLSGFFACTIKYATGWQSINISDP